MSVLDSRLAVACAEDKNRLVTCNLDSKLRRRGTRGEQDQNEANRSQWSENLRRESTGGGGHGLSAQTLARCTAWDPAKAGLPFSDNSLVDVLLS